jgi:hypothetical protein
MYFERYRYWRGCTSALELMRHGYEYKGESWELFVMLMLRMMFSQSVKSLVTHVLLTAAPREVLPKYGIS